MLSYQHGFHAGNLADVHKHALLAGMLAAMAGKDKSLSYLETHAGRGLYDLRSPEAARTGEAAQGVERALAWFPANDPYRRAVEATRGRHGPRAYPGSPLVAATLLRPGDTVRLAELHPQEHAALEQALGPRAAVERRDGLAAALAWTPPTPRRGLMLLDPSWEVKGDYGAIPPLLRQVHAKWSVGVLALWYPLLADARHAPMLLRLQDAFPGALRHEVRFPAARPGHGLEGSGMLVVNAPWRTGERAAWLSGLFAQSLASSPRTDRR